VIVEDQECPHNQLISTTRSWRHLP
jgi:hypothetical protein